MIFRCIFPGEEEVEDEEGEDSFPMDGPLNQSVPIVLTITSQEKEQVMRSEEYGSLWCQITDLPSQMGILYLLLHCRMKENELQS